MCRCCSIGVKHSVAQKADGVVIPVRLHLAQELSQRNVCIPQRPFQSVPIDFFMKREDDDSPIRMLHFEMTSASMNFHKAEPLKSCQHFAT